MGLLLLNHRHGHSGVCATACDSQSRSASGVRRLTQEEKRERPRHTPTQGTC